MCDNNFNYEYQLKMKTDEGKCASIFLKDLILELEDQLHTLKLQIEKQNILLKNKELECKEVERTRDHNLNIFSPIHMNSDISNALSNELNSINVNIEQLQLKEKEVLLKIEGLRNSADYIDTISSNLVDYCTDKILEYKQRLTDKGLGILEAQEIERQRIARDLHDSTVQNLTSLVHKSELCIKLIDIDTIRAKLELNSMSNTLKMIINDMRGIIYNLKPMTLDDLGLTITVQRFANKLMNTNNIDVKVTSNEEVKEILPVIKLTVFRIIQEACNNIIKHANASLVHINICYEVNRLNVTVSDDGVGFNKENVKSNNSSDQSSSFGLSIMQERISLLSGSIEIDSSKGKGTIVRISVPLSIYEGEYK